MWSQNHKVWAVHDYSSVHIFSIKDQALKKTTLLFWCRLFSSRLHFHEIHSADRHVFIMKSMILHHCVDPHSFASSIKTKCFTRIKNKAPSHPLGVLIFSFPGFLGCLSASDRKWHKFYCLGNHQALRWKRSVESASQLERRQVHAGTQQHGCFGT